MIWLFERREEILRLETRFDAPAGLYVLEINWATQPAETEHYGDYDTFHNRLVALEQQLGADQWSQVGSPEILPSGWRGPISH